MYQEVSSDVMYVLCYSSLDHNNLIKNKEVLWLSVDLDVVVVSKINIIQNNYNIFDRRH